MALLHLYAIYQHLIANAFIYSLAALSLYLCLRAGVFNLSTPGIMAVSAYVAGILTVKSGVPWVPALLLGVLAATVLGALLAYPVIRLRGHFLGIATLSFVVLIQVFATNLQGLTGGSLGLINIPVVVNNLELIVIVGLVVYAAYRVAGSRVGRAWDTIRLDESLARTVGVDVGRYKLLVFVLSTVIAALAGALWAYENRVLVPQTFGFTMLTNFLVYVFVGGVLHPLGPLVGTFIISTMPQWFGGLQASAEFVIGVALIISIIYAPEGLIGILYKSVRRRRPGAGRQQTPSPVEGLSGQDAGPTGLGRSRDRRPHVLELTDVGRSFGGVEALRGVGFSIRSGEVVALIGPNGAGKTTLVNCVSGLIPASQGAICMDGVETTQWPAHRIAAEANIRRTFQTSRLLADMSVLKNVLVGYHARLQTDVATALFHPASERSAEREAKSRARDVLELVGLTDVLSSAAGELPYGFQRRVELARALVSAPDMLLLDEPAAGLSEQEIDIFKGILRRIAEQDGVGVLLIEHNVDLVMDVADRIVVLNFGEKIAEGAPSDVRRDAKVVDVYLGVQERSDGEDRRVSNE